MLLLYNGKGGMQITQYSLHTDIVITWNVRYSGALLFCLYCGMNNIQDMTVEFDNVHCKIGKTTEFSGEIDLKVWSYEKFLALWPIGNSYIILTSTCIPKIAENEIIEKNNKASLIKLRLLVESLNSWIEWLDSYQGITPH